MAPSMPASSACPPWLAMLGLTSRSSTAVTRRARSVFRPAPGDCGRTGGADGGTGSRAHREGRKGERWGRRLVRVEDHEPAAQPVLAPVDRGAAQLRDAVVGDHDGEIPLVLHGVASADLSLRLERQRADVFAVGLAGDPYGQHAVARVGRGGAEVAHALEGRCRDGEECGGWVGHRSTIAPWTACS